MKKRIMVDMDEVLVSGGFLYLINKFEKKNYTEKDFKEFYMQNVITDKDNFFKYFLTENLYDYCTLKAGAKEILEELSKHYEIYICTAYIYEDILKESGIILKYKYEYLIENFPFINPNNFIFTGDKSVVDCEIKIDDRVVNLENSDIKLLFDAYHNRSISNLELQEKNIIRVYDWFDIRRILLDN